jgi:hypothetical protein
MPSISWRAILKIAAVCTLISSPPIGNSILTLISPILVILYNLPDYPGILGESNQLSEILLREAALGNKRTFISILKMSAFLVVVRQSSVSSKSGV